MFGGLCISPRGVSTVEMGWMACWSVRVSEKGSGETVQIPATDGITVAVGDI